MQHAIRQAADLAVSQSLSRRLQERRHLVLRNFTASYRLPETNLFGSKFFARRVALDQSTYAL